MSYLRWEKPKRTRSKEEHAEISFEDGPKGGYVPNMSEADANSWKAKVTGTKLGYPQVEVRKTAGPALLLLIVNLGDGYNYKQYETKPSRWHHADREPWWRLHDTRTFGIGLHVATNGGAQLTTEETLQLPLIIEEAKAVLNQLVKVPGERHHYALWLNKGEDFAALKEQIEELGGKVSVEIPEFEFLYFTAPKALLQPIWELGTFRGLFMAKDIAALSQEIDDFRTSPSSLRQQLEERLLVSAGPDRIHWLARRDQFTNPDDVKAAFTRLLRSA